MKGTRFRYRGLGIALVAALGIVAMLALPGLASARGHHHHGRHARHHFMGRHGSRRVLIRGNASDTMASPMEQENAGEVESFEGGTLTIKLFAGGTVSGKVTESTEIECESTEAQASSEDSQEGGENGTENSDQSQQSDDQQSSDEGDSSDTEDQSSSSSSSSCGTESLVKGAIVHEAELVVGSHGAVFQSVDLAG